MTEGEPKLRRIRDLETVKRLFTRSPKEEREELAKQGIYYVGTDEQFEKIQRIIAESGAIMEIVESHSEPESPVETTDGDA
jgi:hypothetical protein